MCEYFCHTDANLLSVVFTFTLYVITLHETFALSGVNIPVDLLMINMNKLYSYKINILMELNAATKSLVH